MTTQEAAKIVAVRFATNTNAQKIDPTWLIALAQVIFDVIKYCESKNDLSSFRNSVSLALSPLRRYVGVGRRVRDSLKTAVTANMPAANTDEMVKAILEAAKDASDKDLVDLIASVDKIDHNP